MEIREFAESILFSASLDEKLRSPGELTDAHPGPPLKTHAEPDRPDGLRFATRQTKFNFPAPHELERDPIRGRLLHFFANHELLATELMALALLKFPDAPKEFRAGLLRTLMDEQAHTKMYLGRLGQLGVEFGQFPVNGFFWRVIADMPTPFDYVSRLSLTFEQANLDYSRLFAARFRQIGDAPSEKLMDRIYHDEINHVGFGLEWFRQWKSPGQSDWEAFQNQLQIPLSPSRAKAEPFNREGRRAAGLDDEFIDRLHVYSRSKGRTPHIYHFNPFAESFMGRGRAFAPNRRQAALARDLETLPAFLCRKDDVVLVKQAPDTAFLARLKEAGFEPPEFEILQDQRIATNSQLRTRKIGGFRPWAWSPDSIELLQPLFGNFAAPIPPTDAEWETRIQPLYSKATASELLRELLAASDDTEWLCDEPQIGVMAKDVDHAQDLINDWRHRGVTKLVAKMCFGVAGTNMQRLWEPEVTAQQRTWLERAIDSDGGVVIEPWLDRVLDFSFQFDMSGPKLRPLGTVRMINDHRGQYQASVHHPRFTTGLDPQTAALLNGPRGGRLKRLQATLTDLLSPRLHTAGFQGAFGIDAFVYRESDRLLLKPVVEINPRFTMGRLMLELMRHAANGSSGRLELVTPATLKREDFTSFTDYANQLSNRLPLKLTGAPKTRIAQGAVCLNAPSRAQGCLAVLQITRT